MPVSIDFSSYYTFGYASRTQLKHAKHDQRHELKQNLAENLRTGCSQNFLQDPGSGGQDKEPER